MPHGNEGQSYKNETASTQLESAKTRIILGNMINEFLVENAQSLTKEQIVAVLKLGVAKGFTGIRLHTDKVWKGSFDLHIGFIGRDGGSYINRITADGNCFLDKAEVKS